MEIAKLEIIAIEEAVAASVAPENEELNALRLTLLGGGLGDVFVG